MKMCPLIQKLEDCDEINSIVCVTGQHEEMLNQVIDIFHIRIDYNLHIMRPKQTLTTITVNILSKIEEIIQKENPDIVLVHGDTTTSFVVGLAAFYQRIPVGHVEAGLRTFNKYSPFPEEMNRNLTGRIAELHFSPTISNSNNLIAEGIISNVFVTGNTVIDAFQTTVRRDYEFKDEVLRTIDFSKRKCILLTAHRRENFGQPLANICNAVRRIAREQDVIVIYPVHLNPIVRNAANSILSEEENVYLINPIDVEDMHNLLARSYLIMTDSGGLQEEAPAFGVPVLVLRTETERPEAVEAGTVKVVGIGEDDIYENAKELLINSNSYEKMAKAVNPYGDGHASERIIEILLTWWEERQE
ncbi:MAG TPA: UDP-N-acetylglucosamine 2-epimerase (non-hydrolyzing) [Lachnospiraceae bacterium]|nr:UDP-N-acetylglucosamine 2-epimerase (non-hydrolyzing) [Lachnospiraceae bacterium]